MSLKHTPFDGSAHPFGIGLRPLDLANWIEVDDKLEEYLSEKHRLLGVMPEKVWAADFASEAAQLEVLELLIAHLLEQFPDVYSRSNGCIQVGGQFDIDLDDISRPPLLLASLLVQEDLVLMRNTEAGWRLVAACVCFPSSWVLREKIGKVMHDVHKPVPGFDKGSRNAALIERMFDNLKAELPVERFNWSVYSDDDLYHAERASDHVESVTNQNASPFLRVEHQTLRKLPKSGDVLFTIRIHLDPLDALRHRDDRKVIGKGFVETIRSMDEAQLRYKGLDQVREELILRIEAVTA